MHKGYKVISVTPAGRKRYVEILHKYLINLRHIIDCHVWWINTNNQNDIAFLENLSKEYPDFYKLKFLSDPPSGKFDNSNIHRFFDDCKDPETVYVRFDDDIVFVDTEGFEGYIDFRINHPEYFIVYANIINNNLCTYLHQMSGAVGVGEYFDQKSSPLLKYEPFNDTLTHPNYTLRVFKDFFTKYSENKLIDFKFRRWIFHHYERCSVNCISWLGKEFAKFNDVGWDEEPWLSTYKPQERIMKNCVYGDFLVVHYSYGLVREKIEQYENGLFLKMFNNIADKQNPSK